MAGFVLRHFMDGVVDGVQAVLLGAGGQVELALGSAELAVHTPGQVLLGGGGHVGLQGAAQHLGELGSVLSLLVSSLLPVQAHLGIALPVCDPGHAQVHTYFAALAGEVGLQLLQDISLVGLGDVGVVPNGLFVDAELMLGSQLGGVHFLELGAVHMAHGALEAFGDLVPFVNVTADRANKLLHNKFLHNFVCDIVCDFMCDFYSVTSSNWSGPTPQRGHS